MHLGQSNAGHRHRPGDKQLESSSAERGLGVLVATAQHEPSVCRGSQESKMHFGEH